MKTAVSLCAILCGLLGVETAFAQQPPSPATSGQPQLSPVTTEVLPAVGSTTTFVVKPVLLDAENASGTTLALDYDLQISRLRPFGGTTSRGRDRVTVDDADVAIKEGELLFRARGTVAASKAKNPHKFADVSLSAFYGLSRIEAYYRLGVQGAFETDQSFDNKQYAFSVLGAVSKVTIFTPGDAGSVLLGYGTVNPKDDKNREAVLGTLDTYKRWNLEASYSYPINRSKVRSLDFNYRHYRETGAPLAVRQAGLDSFRLWLVRLNLHDDFFVQYSNGSLPFDQQSQRAVKIGWALKLE